MYCMVLFSNRAANLWADISAPGDLIPNTKRFEKSPVNGRGCWYAARRAERYWVFKWMLIKAPRDSSANPNGVQVRAVWRGTALHFTHAPKRRLNLTCFIFVQSDLRTGLEKMEWLRPRAHTCTCTCTCFASLPERVKISSGIQLAAQWPTQIISWDRARRLMFWVNDSFAF